MGLFLFFGAVMASLAGATLIWRGTFLEHLIFFFTLSSAQLLQGRLMTAQASVKPDPSTALERFDAGLTC